MLLSLAESSTQGNTNTANDNSTTNLTVNAILPVTLNSFDATIKDCNATLKWNSSAEINFKHYAVEYSNDGIKYDIITILPGKGDNQSYRLLHHPQQGKAYYRLKLVDKDNKYDYSKIISVNVNCIRSNVSVFPNPVSDILNVNISNFQSGIVNGIIYNSSGKKIASKQFKNGTNIFNVKTLTPGSYTLTLYKLDGVESIKISKY